MVCFEPLDPSDIADEEVGADAADVGDEKAAVGDGVDIRHHVVTQMLVPVTPLAAADRIRHKNTKLEQKSSEFNSLSIQPKD